MSDRADKIQAELTDELGNPINSSNPLPVTGPKKATASESGKSETVGTSSTSVLAANSNRIEATFVNDSDEAIYLEKGTGATVGEGIRLNPYGGSYIETVYTGVFHAICASGGKNLVITET